MLINSENFALHKIGWFVILLFQGIYKIKPSLIDYMALIGGRMEIRCKLKREEVKFDESLKRFE